LLDRLDYTDWRTPWKVDVDIGKKGDGDGARSEDHARRTGTLRPGRLDIQRNLGGLIEAFPDAAVLNSRAFYDKVLATLCDFHGLDIVD
jgi:hypothetical protein